MRWDSGRLSIAFSCVGHTYIHLFTAFFFTIILALEDVWQLSYADLLDLWLPAALLVGVAALPAGWLGDRWSLSGMMVVFFLGLGIASITAGLVGGEIGMLMALAGIGLFAAIYHPVAIPWVMRSSRARLGATLALNGIFGGLGIGLAGIVSGGLIDLVSWRAAFIVPGVICLATGIYMWRLMATGRITEPAFREEPKASRPTRDAATRAFVVLLATMFLGGLIFHVTQTAAPKLFDLRLSEWIGEGTLGVGALVAFVYVTAAFAQFLGGWLADRWPLKLVYILTWALQIPLLLIAAQIGGPLLVLAALLVASANTASLPAENMLLAHYTPPARHGLVFGIKFVLAFGAAPIGIKLVGWLQAMTGEFVLVYSLMAAVALAIALLALLLPRPSRAPAAAAVAAE